MRQVRNTIDRYFGNLWESKPEQLIYSPAHILRDDHYMYNLQRTIINV